MENRILGWLIPSILDTLKVWVIETQQIAIPWLHESPRNENSPGIGIPKQTVMISL